MAPRKNKNKNKNDEKKGEEGTLAGGPDISRLDQSLDETIRGGASRGRAESVASRGRAESASSPGKLYQWRPTAASFNALAPVYQGGGFKGATLRDDPSNANFLATGGGNAFATVNNNERAFDNACQMAKEDIKARNPGGFRAVSVAVFRTSQHAKAQTTRRLADRLRMGLLPLPPPPSAPLGGGSLPGGGATAPALGGGSTAGGSNPAGNSAKASDQASQEASGGASGGASGKKRKRGGKKANRGNEDEDEHEHEDEREREEDDGRSRKKTHAELDAELNQYFRDNNADK
ncbi:hypothetical protein DL767_007487 [Monosporascus sp. MG133]|nr:hypothetical protein DL767_007487 [Monosporascus sp. MG133]